MSYPQQFQGYDGFPPPAPRQQYKQAPVRQAVAAPSPTQGQFYPGGPPPQQYPRQRQPSQPTPQQYPGAPPPPRRGPSPQQYQQQPPPPPPAPQQQMYERRPSHPQQYSALPNGMPRPQQQQHQQHQQQQQHQGQRYDPRFAQPQRSPTSPPVPPSQMQPRAPYAHPPQPSRSASPSINQQRMMAMPMPNQPPPPPQAMQQPPPRSQQRPPAPAQGYPVQAQGPPAGYPPPPQQYAQYTHSHSQPDLSDLSSGMQNLNMDHTPKLDNPGPIVTPYVNSRSASPTMQNTYPKQYPMHSQNLQHSQRQPEYGDQYDPTSPTAITNGDDYKSNYHQQRYGDHKISTNKIPPSSTVGNAMVSPLAAEYRRDMDMEGSPGNNSLSSKSSDLVNMYLDSEIREHERAVSGGSQEHGQMPPLNRSGSNMYQSDVQPLRAMSQTSYHSETTDHYPQPYPQSFANPQQQHQQQYQHMQQQQQQQHHPQPDKAPPPPRRQYTDTTSTSSASEVPKSKELTVQELEHLRNVSNSQPNDPKPQLEFAKKLVEACEKLAGQYANPETPAHSGRVDSKTERRNKEAWSHQAYKMVKRLAQSQYPDAMFYLASQYSSGGMGVDVDYEKAYELYNKAAKLDQSEAAYRVAVCNEIGAGTKKDTPKALAWYKKAAQMGDVSAMYKLGMISLNGLLGQHKSFAEAVTWFQRAAERADSDTPHAVHELGLLYERVDSLDMSAVNEMGTATVIKRDERKAFELFMKAAKLGYPPSQFRLGCCYEYGTLSCTIDPKRSIAWYSRAAEKGEPESELALSGWYLTGSEGILGQSDTEAYLWARKAAEKGLAKAEYALGYFSEVGIGVQPNQEEARRWYYKAAAQKHPKALARLQELRS